MPHKGPEKRKAYNAAYREANKEKAKAYREGNKEKANAYSKAYYEANREKLNASSKAYYEANREKLNASSRAYREANKEKLKARDKAYREANREKLNASSRAYREVNKEKIAATTLAYYEANKDKFFAKNAKARALKAPALLPTTDDKLIQNLYKQREHMSKKRNEVYHVDHIIPLSIGGAHHQDNLRIITAKENLEKKDKYIPELGGVWADNDLARETKKKLGIK